MHISDLYEDPLLTTFFGAARVTDLGRRFREVVPDFPQGKGDKGKVNINHAIWFLYVLAKVKSINDKKEVQYAISSLVNTTNEYGESIYISLCNLFAFESSISSVNEIRVSKISDHAQIIYTDNSIEEFFGTIRNKELVENIDEITVLKRKFVIDFFNRWETPEEEDNHPGFEAED